MRNELTMFLGSVIVLFSAIASAEPAPPDLDGLLAIGSSGAQTHLKWNTGLEAVQSLYPGFSPTASYIGISSLHGAALYRGCMFNLRLEGGINPELQGKLKSAQADYKTGDLQKCRHGLESTLTALYGRPNITKHPAGWPDGGGPPATVVSNWQTPTTCIRLWWEDGEGSWGPSLRLSLNDNGGVGCGGYEDEVVTVGHRIKKK